MKCSWTCRRGWLRCFFDHVNLIQLGRVLRHSHVNGYQVEQSVGDDMTASNLANAPPGMQKQMLGEKIFPSPGL